MKDESSSLPPGVTPVVLSERAAAEFIGESLHVRRQKRYADQERRSRGERIQGPAWFKDGKRLIKYKLADLQSYVEKLGVAA